LTVAKKPASKKQLTGSKKPTEKQRLFCGFYVGAAHGNATEAARMAKYKGDVNTLSQVGRDNLRNPVVVQLIDELNAQIGKSPRKFIIKGRRVLELLSMIAEGDESLTKDELVTTVSGTVVTDPRKMTPEILAHIDANGVPPPGADIYYHPPVKVSDRKSALTDLAKIWRLYEDQTPQTAIYVFERLIPALSLPQEVAVQVAAAVAKLKAGAAA
jgi:hypothetical protein